MSAPSVTLGVSCYRQAELVVSLVDSLVQTLLPGDEILIADDGSGAEQLALLRPLCDRHSNVRVIEGVPSGRAATNRNRLIAGARADYLISIDGDDALNPGWRTALRDAVAVLPGAEVVFWDYAFVEPSGSTTASSALRARGLYEGITALRQEGASEDVYQLDARRLQRLALGESSPLHTVNCLIQRETLLARGLLWDDRFRVAEDTDFFVRLLRCQRVVYVDRVLGAYRIGEHGLTRTDRLESDLARVVQRYALFLEAARAGILDEEMWERIELRVAGAEKELAYNLRRYGASKRALRAALRSGLIDVSRETWLEVVKSIVRTRTSDESAASAAYWPSSLVGRG